MYDYQVTYQTMAHVSTGPSPQIMSEIVQADDFFHSNGYFYFMVNSFGVILVLKDVLSVRCLTPVHKKPDEQVEVDLKNLVQATDPNAQP